MVVIIRANVLGQTKDYSLSLSHLTQPYMEVCIGRHFKLGVHYSMGKKL